ncbi:uncharacterized protein BO95DRAFT_468561 [Aspergillus brunneoviolaceus CBS 621.78]|uniref:Uncharacterized protein n=1 Tax=Aspergillus brunneoviolaceus CBS 621.78 TaxID=1450534 RepID=A0ACD1FUJ4_9EURO|nr:hypothetical protein BO95DRAFT_468561 [Aspergillus brunneoviolaceus CBS 621.78]RAH40643.1 hypothetical protein BO95DRAFT_468561 [Aspergillus brunneoviolaceus CBS 621.78]
MPGLHRAPVDPGSLPPPEYWNSFEPLYTNSDPSLQHAHPPQQQLHQQPPPQPQSQSQSRSQSRLQSQPQPQPQQSQQPQQPQQQQQQQQSSHQPLGISWDHPVFGQNPPSRSPLPTPQDQNHGLYSSSPQSWRAAALHPQPILPATAHPIGMTSQYRQAPQFSSAHPAYDTQPLPASDSAHFPSYTFPRSYYPPQNLPVPDVFPQSHMHSPPAAQPQPQATHFRSDPHPHHVPQYSLPAGYAERNSQVPMDYNTEFTRSTPPVSNQTINPQFLSSAQQAAANQQAALHPNNLLYLNPSEYDRTDEPKLYTFYREDLQMPPAMGQSVAPSQPIAPKPQSAYEFVLPLNGPNLAQSLAAAKGGKAKKPATKKQTTSQSTKTTVKGSSKKVDGTAESSESETDSSDSELEIEDRAPEEPSPLPVSRPSEPEAAAKYDALKAVWSPRNRRPNVDKVKSALVAFKDVVKTVRDAWKDSSQAMKAAENTGNNDKAAQLKKDVVLQRRLMDVVVCATLEMGHPIIVEKLGEHPIAVAAMYSFLLDRHQAADINGTLTLNILKLLSRFVTMDEDVLQKTNVAKLLPRFVKKGGPAVRDLAQKIMDNAAASTRRKQDTAKPAAKDGSPSKQTSTVTATAAPDGARAELAGSKRPRDTESNGQPATKRVVVASHAKNAAKPVSAVAPVRRPQEAGPENKAAAAAAAAQPSRPKTNIVAPKPTNLFGSLSSASKRPGTSNAERAAAAAAKTSNPSERKEPQPAPPRPTFSFGDLMADLNKPKETTPAQPSEPKSPETEEERKRRLRKEARRRLRVTWKPDESLTEVRLFTHDPDEELGPGDHMQREAGDVKGEGSVLKLHRDLDEEEDEEGGFREEQLLEYLLPSEIDFEDMPYEERGRNFIKRGGIEVPESAERKAQEYREATTLMVFYTSPADVPSTPKEPPPPDNEEPTTVAVSFGEVPDHVKARQNRYIAAVKPQPPPAAAPAASAQAPFDISNLLKIIQSAPQQPKSTPPPQTQPAAAPISDLERTFSMFCQPQPQPQPQPTSQPPMLQMPQFPAAPQPATGQAIDLQNILAIMNAQKQMQPAATAPQAPPSQPSIAPNLAAIFSQINGQNQPTAGNPPQHTGHFEDPERKRLRESGGYDGTDDDRYSYPKRNRYNDLGKKHPKAGSVPCRYWQSGKCRKGDDCTYRHDPLI